MQTPFGMQPGYFTCFLHGFDEGLLFGKMELGYNKKYVSYEYTDQNRAADLRHVVCRIK